MPVFVEAYSVKEKGGIMMKIKKTVMSGAVASALIFSTIGTGSVFAEEGVVELQAPEIEEAVTVDTDEQRALAEVNVTVEDTVEDGEISEEATTDAEKPMKEGSEDTDQQQEKASTLVPGDFLYFVKIMMEKIRLAVTFDEYKEARMLAQFAAERIAEANVLIAEGKTDEAIELLKKAIAIQDEAAEKLAEAEKTEASDETEVVTEEEATQDSEAIEETTEDTEETTTEDNVTKETEEGIDDEVVENEVEVKLAQNIDALTAALSHVKNPTAQLALMKNIQKSFVKLDKKLAKMEGKAAKYIDETAEEEEKVINETKVSKEEVTETTEEKEAATTDTEAVEKETKTEEQAESEAVVKMEEKIVVAPGLVKKEEAKAKAQEKRAEVQAKVAAKKQEVQQKKAEKEQQVNEKKQNAQKNGSPNNHGKGNE